MVDEKNPEIVSEAEEAVNLSEVLKIRREKLAKLIEDGRDPFVKETWDVDAYSGDIKQDFEKFEGKKVSVAGRIMAKRGMGKASFFDLQDRQGRIQGYTKKDIIGEEEYAYFLTYDVGDIVGIHGEVFKTRHGEISIKVEEIVLLSKSLQVLPEKFHGLKDTDMRYRQRYVDLIMNEDVRNKFMLRTKMLREVRNYLDSRGYMEVETPILTTIAGGANARPFETHHNTLDLDMKLRISNELFLKRCIVGGLDRVYEMGKMFRNEGMDTRHNPEFTNIELYEAFADSDKMMEITEQMISQMAQNSLGTMIIEYQGKKFDLTPPWNRMTMEEAVLKWAGEDFSKVETDEEAQAIAKKHQLDDWQTLTRGKVIAELFEEFCEDHLEGPIFITGHPVDISPLAKRDSSDPRITRRFEAYINCWEVANGFSELNDPIDQLARFTAQQKALESGDEEAHPMDLDYVNALEVGLPPTGGLGIGIDRTIMLLTDSSTIRDVVLFPTMKPIGKKDEGNQDL